jgi:hypothetical protein
MDAQEEQNANPTQRISCLSKKSLKSCSNGGKGVSMDDPFWVGGVDATNRVSKIHLENPAKTTL